MTSGPELLVQHKRFPIPATTPSFVINVPPGNTRAPVARDGGSEVLGIQT
jgi:hypothetical protein